jgi:molybdopterin-biosynthesis enzyme MoeA-like protein
MLKFGALIIGDEILSGKRQDKHLPKIIELLSARGLQLSWARYLGDDRERLTATLKETFASGDVVFSCGGIGATPDDHTRQSAAAALGLPLQLHERAAQLIGERTAEMAREGRGSADMTTLENQQRLRMGEFPQGASLILNPYNKIPGFSVQQHYFVPGFPVMAWPMIEQTLDQNFSHAFALGARAERSFLVYDLPESAATPVMEFLEVQFPEVKTFSLPSMGEAGQRRHIELGVKGSADEVTVAFPIFLNRIQEVLSVHGASLGEIFDLKAQ